MKTPRTDETYEVPAPVIEAARAITLWAETNGLSVFAIGGICSRKHLSQLEQELKEARLLAQQGTETVYRWRKLITEAEEERDQLKKVVDAVIDYDVTFGKPSEGSLARHEAYASLVSSCNSLPHVIAKRKTK